MSFDIENLRAQRIMVDIIGTHRFTIMRAKPMTGICNHCGMDRNDIASRRLNTLYSSDESNWIESCVDCYHDTVDYYNDLWKETY